MSRVIRVTSSFTRPAVVTQYTAGDEVSSHATAGSVVLPTFDLSGWQRARVLRAAMGIVPGSSNLVITACDLALLIFRTADAPAAVGDNTTLPIASSYRLKAAKFAFVNTAWTNPLGALTASTSGFQEVLPAVAVSGAGNAFDLASGSVSSVRTLTGVVQATAAWNPGNVAQAFSIALDVEVE
jgi:hypothetical protein